jgi:hypothetical protein
MARPKLGDSESKRLQMVITEDELHAIEEWQFSNRVPSKSEAIRRLCQLGLLFDRKFPKLIDKTKMPLNASKLPEGKDLKTGEEINQLILSLYSIVAESREFELGILNAIISITAEAQALRMPGIKNALEISQSLRARAESLGEDTEEGRKLMSGFLKAISSARRDAEDSDEGNDE